MTRIFTDDGDPKPAIDQGSVKAFFERRAEKYQQGLIDYQQAIIYQDKSQDLARHRDQAEKALLLPKMQLSGEDRLLDIGCGTGRWAELVGEKVAHYHGTDLTQSLIAVARDRNPGAHLRFTCASCVDLTLDRLGESAGFNKIIMLGVLIYLNDEDVAQALQAVTQVAAAHGTFVLREPIGLDRRLTIKEHYSQDMEQIYNAIYRTEDEIMAYCDRSLVAAGFRLVESGDVYADPAFNNRAETKQKYFIFKR